MVVGQGSIEGHPRGVARRHGKHRGRRRATGVIMEEGGAIYVRGQSIYGEAAELQGSSQRRGKRR